MKAKRWIALLIFIVLLFFYTVAQFSSSQLLASTQAKWPEEVYQQGGLEQIALLEVEGTIMKDSGQGFLSQASYQHELFLEQLESAFKSDQVKAIVLQVNSPGGGVVESDEIYHKIKSLKAEYDKPFVVYMSGMAASGGYYISALADKIYANRSTITGSIGVIMSSINVYELAEKLGIKNQAITSGPHKEIFSPLKPVSSTEQEILQTIVDEMYQNFVAVVAEGRKMPIDKVTTLADGRIYTGLQAKEIGLVDEIGFLDEAIIGAKELAKINNPTVVRYKHAKRWSWSSFDTLQRGHLLQQFLGQPEFPLVPITSSKEPWLQQPAPSFMYMVGW